MARRRRGGLSDDDLAVWAQVAASARPLGPLSKVFPSEPATTKPPPPQPPRPKAPPAVVRSPIGLSSFRVGELAKPQPGTTVLAPDPAARLADQSLRMDLKAHRRLRQGKTSPEARIDLHGMTLSVAEPALTDFVLRQRANGKRLVLVITGKGRRDMPDAPLPVRPGALRHYVPMWLQRPPLGAVVQQVVPAHFRHGGEGAYYVYLRR